MFEWNDDDIQTSCEQAAHELELVQDTFASLEQIANDIAQAQGITRDVAKRLIGVAPSMEGMSEKAFSSFPSDVNLEVALEGFIETFFGGIVKVFEVIFKVIFKMLDLAMRPIYWLFGYDPDGSSSSGGGGGSGGGSSGGNKLTQAGKKVEEVKQKADPFAGNLKKEEKLVNDALEEANGDGRFSYTKLGLKFRDVGKDAQMYKEFNNSMMQGAGLQAIYIKALDDMTKQLNKVTDDPANQQGGVDLSASLSVSRPTKMKLRLREWYNDSFGFLAKTIDSSLHASVSEDYDPARLGEACANARKRVKALAGEKADETLKVADIIAIIHATPKDYYKADSEGEKVAKEIEKNAKAAHGVKKEFTPPEKFKTRDDSERPTEKNGRERFDALKKAVTETNAIGSSMMRCVTEYCHIIPYIVAQRLAMIDAAGKALHLLDDEGMPKKRKES